MVTDSDNLQIVSKLAIATLPDLEFEGILKASRFLTMLDIENGDTLHLVKRQPTQPQTSSSTGPANLSRNGGAQGNDGSVGTPRNRIGQISHSVVLGTLNVGDQGEGVVPNLTRVIGAVLNSLGVGSQPTTNGLVVSQTAASVRFPIVPSLLRVLLLCQA
ncbi:hypothetical protein Cgig2_008828 [Carnegiea gigantea]|uniref:Uncharacterized protein n=1 Tax=Carnegiea gigantea TaxID=171969 RepID=A0A9Q1Q5A8_9CARY|nr:hypothetical protein Cgig2_008828 [Carnegiea gigantea]